jgi:flagellar M-ring protein FliF
MRYAILSCLGLAITGGVIFAAYSSTNKPVALYTTKMSQDDVTACAAELTKLGIAHSVEVTGDAITIEDPRNRAKALIGLAAAGLPKHHVITPNTPQDSQMGTTAAQQKLNRQHMLEGELTETIRQIDGVADAYVKLATPEDVFFRDDAKPCTATVMLKLTPGVQFTQKQVQGLVNLVAFSVPDLDKKNVKVADTTGTDLTATLDQDEENGGVSSGKVGQLETSKAKELTAKAQTQLDKVLGPNRSQVSVNCEMDSAQTQITAHRVGGADANGQLVTQETKLTEEYNKTPNGGSSSGGQAVSGDDQDQANQASMPAEAKNSSDYRNIKENKHVVFDTTDTTKVNKTPQIRKISASVAVDNLKKDEVDKIAGLVSAAIGIDESRGDVLKVESMPFRKAMLAPDAFQIPADAAGRAPATNPGQGNMAQVMAMAMFAVALPMLGLIGLFVLKQHRVQVGKAQLMLDTTNGSTSTDIADLLTDKSGRVSGTSETKVNTSDALEKLAKEKPTKVAEMLKSTWLSG